MKSAKFIIENLTSYDGNLIFCDDSDVDGKPNPNFVPDIRVLCAVQINSDNYRCLGLSKFLNRLLKKELHTTEVVNPNKKSEWYGVGISERINLLNDVKEFIVDNVEKIYYCQVSKEQYSELRKKAERKGRVDMKMNNGLKRVFVRKLLSITASLNNPTILILDQDENIEVPEFYSEYKAEHLEGGAPIKVDSSMVPGIQIADFAAWSITRYIRKRHKWDTEIKNPFDTVAAELLADMSGKIQHILNA